MKVELSYKARKGAYDAYLTLTTPDYENAQYTYPLIKGNYFTDNDVANANPVCVIDELTAAYLFGNTDVIGMNLDVNVDNNIQTLSVIGVRETPEEMLVAEKQYIAMGMSESISIEIPYTLSTAFGNPVDGFMSLNLMTYNKDDTARAARTAVQILNSRHQNLGDEPFMQQKAIDLTDMFGPIMDAVNSIRGARRRNLSCRRRNRRYEHHARIRHGTGLVRVGIRKSLGAKTGSIIAQFLCESVIISGMGGIIGIILGGGLTALISFLEIGGIKAQLSLPAVIVATVFSCGVGIIFGIYPARNGRFTQSY